MLPKYHFFIGVIFAVVLYFLFPHIGIINILIIFISNIFIDADHGLYYVLKEKNLNPFKCYNWYKFNRKKTLSLPINERKKIYSGFYLFHGIEWIIILFLLGKYFNAFYFVSLGFFLHWIVDFYDEYVQKGTVDKISLIYNVYRWRKLENKKERI